jgi:hypothetical protein
MVRPERFELPTYCSGGNRSIQSELRAHALYSLHAARNSIKSALADHSLSELQGFRAEYAKTGLILFTSDRGAHRHRRVHRDLRDPARHHRRVPLSAGLH